MMKNLLLACSSHMQNTWLALRPLPHLVCTSVGNVLLPGHLQTPLQKLSAHELLNPPKDKT